MATPINFTQLLNVSSNFTGTTGGITKLSLEETIANVCYQVHRNNIYLLFFMVGLWLTRYIYKQILKYKYKKKNIPIPTTVQTIYEIIDETLDLFQSTYILYVLLLMFY